MEQGHIKFTDNNGNSLTNLNDTDIEDFVPFSNDTVKHNQKKQVYEVKIHKSNVPQWSDKDVNELQNTQMTTATIVVMAKIKAAKLEHARDDGLILDLFR
jgi:replication initiation and membrane attachment protein DnaB